VSDDPAGSDVPDVPDGSDGPDGSDAPDDLDLAAGAARQALARVRAVAQARGLRPGLPPRSRRRRVPGEPPRPGASTTDRDPQELGLGLERLVAERGWQVDVAVGGVLGRWSRVVGPQVSGHCAPESFREGVLLVRADSTAWATQVRLLVPTLLRRLAEELGEGVVVQVQVRGPAGPNWQRGRRAVQGRGPRDTYG
jgi:predicted nucleic acid-binding Zn ribbon protein